MIATPAEHDPRLDPDAEPSPEPDRLAAIQSRLLAWYAAEARDLPWRRSRDPYAILVSEVMLQQTGVDRVVPLWHAWLDRFPTIADLATAPRADVIRAWAGLGYNLRAIRLHEIARQVIAEHDGRLPDTPDALARLKGIGPYTAGAVACFAYEQPVAMVDTNIRRVLGRIFFGRPLTNTTDDRAIARLAAAVLPSQDAFAWNQALMDLGATLCRVQRTACLLCPLRDVCRAAPSMSTWPETRRRLLNESKADYHAPARRASGERRLLRGRIIAVLRGAAPGTDVPVQHLCTALQPGAPTEATLLATVKRLGDDGLVVLSQTSAALALRLADQ